MLKAFKAIRPVAELASKVAALPYDVMDSKEARKKAMDNPYSFLHVDKAEIDLDSSVDLYDLKVYEKARDNLKNMIKKGILVKDSKENLYIYKQVMKEHEQIGLVGCVSVDDYINGRIKKHENTRKDKEKDRINHVRYCNANTGPIFLTYRSKEEINIVIQNWIDNNNPVYDFISQDGVKHVVWVIDNNQTIKELINQFTTLDNLYIADGHHRTAAAVEVAKIKREENPSFTGDEEFNYFLGVLFPHDQLYIMDYNRVVKDLNGYSCTQFIEKIKEKFQVEEFKGEGYYKPDRKHSFGMYLDNKWYKLTARDGSFNSDDTVDSLDVSILQNNILEPILGIKDPRTDERIDFIGGVRGIEELEKRVNEGMALAFALYPSTIEDLIKISDEDKIMPPKSTWFEPKLRSGLFIHDLDS